MNKFIPEIYEFYKKTISCQLKGVCGCALTFDTWTSLGAKRFLTITLHFINCNFERKKFTIKTSKFEESQTAKNIAKIVDQALKEFLAEGKSNIIEYYAVTDSGKNMISAVELLGFTQFRCLAHMFHNDLLEGIKIAKIDTLIAKCHEIVHRVRQKSLSLFYYEKSYLFPKDL